MAFNLKGEAQIDAFTLGFNVHGENGHWRVSVSGPGNISDECETVEDNPWPLLVEMLTEGVNEICRKFPRRAPHKRATP